MQRQKRKEERLLQEKERAELEEVTRTFLQRPQQLLLFDQNKNCKPVASTAKTIIRSNSAPRSMLRTSGSMSDLLYDSDSDSDEEQAQSDFETSYSSIEKRLAPLQKQSKQQGEEDKSGFDKPLLQGIGRGSLSSGFDLRSATEHLKRSTSTGTSTTSSTGDQSLLYKRQSSSQSLLLQISSHTKHYPSSPNLTSLLHSSSTTTNSTPQTPTPTPTQNKRELRKQDSSATLRARLKAPSKDTRPYNKDNEKSNGNKKKKDDQQMQMAEEETMEKEDELLSSMHKPSSIHSTTNNDRTGREPKRGNLQRTRSRSLSDLRGYKGGGVPETPRTAKKKLIKRASNRNLLIDSTTTDKGDETPRSSARRRKTVGDNSIKNNTIKRQSSSKALLLLQDRERSETTTTTTTTTTMDQPLPPFATPRRSKPKKKVATASLRSNNSQDGSYSSSSTNNKERNIPVDPFASHTQKSKKKTTNRSASQRSLLSAAEYQVVKKKKNKKNDAIMTKKTSSLTTTEKRESVKNKKKVIQKSNSSRELLLSNNSDNNNNDDRSNRKDMAMPKTPKQKRRQSVGGSLHNHDNKRASSTRHLMTSKSNSPKASAKANANANSPTQESFTNATKDAKRKGREPKRGNVQRTRSRSLTDLRPTSRRDQNHRRASTRNLMMKDNTDQGNSSRKKSTTADITSTTTTTTTTSSTTSSAEDLDPTNRRSALTKRMSERRFEDNCADMPVKSPQRVYKTRKPKDNVDVSNAADQLSTPTSNQSTSSNSRNSLVTPRGSKKKKPQLGSWQWDDDNSDNKNKHESVANLKLEEGETLFAPPSKKHSPKGRSASTKSKASSKTTPTSDMLTSDSFHSPAKPSPMTPKWNMANPEQVQKWKCKLAAAPLSPKTAEVAAAPPGKPERKHSITSAQPTSHSRASLSSAPALVSLHSRDTILRKSSSGDSSELLPFEMLNSPMPGAKPKAPNMDGISSLKEPITPKKQRNLPTRDTNKTVVDKGRPDRMRELMQRTRSQSLSNLQAAAKQSPSDANRLLRDDSSNLGASTFHHPRQLPSRIQNQSVDNAGRLIPMRGMLQRTQSRSLTNLFGDRKDDYTPSGPSALAHMHRQNSRKSIFQSDENDPNKVIVPKKKKHLPKRQESEPSGLVTKKKLPKRQESEPSGLITQRIPEHECENEKPLVDLKSHIRRDSKRNKNPNTGTPSTRSVSSAEVGSTSSGQMKRGRAAPGKRRGVARQRSRSLSDLASNGRRSGKKPGTSEKEAAVPYADLAMDTEGFAEAAFSAFKSTRTKEKGSSEPRPNSLDDHAVSPTKSTEAQASRNESTNRGRNPRQDRSITRQRSSSLTDLRPNPPCLSYAHNRNNASLSCLVEERGIRVLKKRIANLEELLCIEKAGLEELPPSMNEGQIPSLKALVYCLEEENAKELAELKRGKEKIFDLEQKNIKLEQMTKQTRKYYTELEALDRTEAMKYKALSNNAPTIRAVVEFHEIKLARRVQRIEFERRTALHYKVKIQSILELLQEKCQDSDLIETLKELIFLYDGVKD